MFPDPNQWPAVVSPCSDVVAWQPWWQVFHTLVWSVSIWPRVNRTSYLFHKSPPIFASKQQILPDLCLERVIIWYNLLAGFSAWEDNKLVILLLRPGWGFFFLQLSLTTVFSSLLHPSISLHFSVADLHLFFFTLLSHLLSPLSLSALTSLAKYLGNEYFLSHRKGFSCFFSLTC